MVMLTVNQMGSGFTAAHGLLARILSRHLTSTLPL